MKSVKYLLLFCCLILTVINQPKANELCNDLHFRIKNNAQGITYVSKLLIVIDVANEDVYEKRIESLDNYLSESSSLYQSCLDGQSIAIEELDKILSKIYVLKESSDADKVFIVAYSQERQEGALSFIERRLRSSFDEKYLEMQEFQDAWSEAQVQLAKLQDIASLFMESPDAELYTLFLEENEGYTEKKDSLLNSLSKLLASLSKKGNSHLLKIIELLEERISKYREKIFAEEIAIVVYQSKLREAHLRAIAYSLKRITFLIQLSTARDRKQILALRKEISKLDSLIRVEINFIVKANHQIEIKRKRIDRFRQVINHLDTRLQVLRSKI